MRSRLAPLAALLVVLCASRAAAEPEPSAWAEIVRIRVNGAGEVAYRAIRLWDASLLDGVALWLAAADPAGLDPDEAIAFWINAYNAAAVLAVVRGESPETPVSRARMFAVFQLRVAGRERTLDEIGGILDVAAHADPRIHFALCGATRGYPPLAAEPYDGAGLDAQLAAAAQRFVRSPAALRFDAGPVEFSEFFRWYRVDFSRAGVTPERFAASFLPFGPQRKALEEGRTAVVFRSFDWTPNAQSGEWPP